MFRVLITCGVVLASAAWHVAATAADLATLWGCTEAGPEGGCGPACSARWHEERTTKPAYTIRCEYGCARARDAWHAPPPECRCCPPAGAVYVKKRLYKSDGETRVEKVPKYEAATGGAGDGRACGGGCTGGSPPFPNPETLP